MQNLQTAVDDHTRLDRAVTSLSLFIHAEKSLDILLADHLLILAGIEAP